LGATINGFHSLLGKGGVGNDGDRKKPVQLVEKVTDIGHFKTERGVGRIKAWQRFISDCKVISNHIKLGQREVERQSVLDYLNYKELVNQEIEAHNKAIEKSNKK
jgi:hypothetical protein